VTWTTRDFTDCGHFCYAARVRRDGTHRIAFEVFKVFGKDEHGNIYCKTHEGPQDGITSDVNEAVPFVRGHIKWDGCCNFEFDELAEGDAMLHACGRSEMTGLGALFGHLYDLAEELMPEHAEYLARKEQTT